MKGNGNMGVWLNSTATAYAGNMGQRESASSCSNAYNGVNASMQTTSAYLNRTTQNTEMQVGYSQRAASSFGQTAAYGILQPVGTGSFVAINEQMEYGVMGYESVAEPTGLMRAKRPGGDEAIGQLVPVGDMVVPMMVCAVAYCIVKAVKKMVKSNKTL